MIAEVDWATLIPSTITAIAVPLVGYMTVKIHVTTKAIDRAVNGQPPLEPPMVEKVKEILTEQSRVAAEHAKEVK